MKAFKSKKGKRLLVSVLIISFVFSLITLYGNLRLHTDVIKLTDDRIQIEGDFRIAHISDYHNQKSRLIDEQIFKALDKFPPDVIFITGDLIDCNKTDVNKALEFCKRLCAYATVYYVTGNHECNFSIINQAAFDDMLKELLAMGVVVLRQSAVELKADNGEIINVFGIDDPYFHCEYSSQLASTTYDLCSDFKPKDGELDILLAHHPEQMEIYSLIGFDMVFSGHAHGGQGRIFKQGLIAPDQGFFPEYTGGIYTEQQTFLFLSRGIGNSVVPVRVFNNPNLIILEI